MKTCSKGHELTPENINSEGKCKECARLRSSSWYANNKQRASDAAKIYRDRNKEKIKADKQRYYEENREEFLENRKRDRKENPRKHKSFDLKKKYGITIDEWEQMLKDQNYKCAACPATEPGGKYNEWHTDHDHVSGKVRGLLCAPCNLTIGNALEDSARLRACADYLDKNKI